MALRGDLLLVGEPDPGGAHLYRQAPSGAWTHAAHLAASEPHLGRAVALATDLVVLASHGSPGDPAPRVVAFERAPDGAWRQLAPLDLGAPARRATHLELALEAEFLAVRLASSAVGDDPHLVLFERAPGSPTGFAPARPVPLPPGTQRLRGLAATATHLAVGASSDTPVAWKQASVPIGHVLVHRRSGPATWHLDATLHPPRPQTHDAPREGEDFGLALAFSGGHLLVGDPSALPGHRHALETRGAVYAYSAPSWALAATLTAPDDARPHQAFGVQLAASGHHAVVRASLRPPRPDQLVRDHPLFLFELPAERPPQLLGRLEVPSDTRAGLALALDARRLAVSARPHPPSPDATAGLFVLSPAAHPPPRKSP